MSHIVSIKTQVKDPVAVSTACTRLGLAPPVVGTTELYGGHVNGMIIRLPGWIYPAVADLVTGEVKFDNYEGRWGERGELDKFLQAYAVEKAKLEARAKGLAVTEAALADGSIKLQVTERA